MNTITCLKELEEKGELKEGDTVKFTIKKETIEYRVRGLYLDNLKSPGMSEYNNEIFRILKIDKNKIAAKAYGEIIIDLLSTNSPYWPSTKEENFPALTRLVKELYRIIKEREPKYTKFTRFEIMDI